ncbi:hypothetical protein FT641_19575 [Bacillus paranthracis]|uniref:hypothetical protein n=1 Tax=Bacillus paranthracis TaxID=2026186 RepID=UPI0018792516|nr:hypothetical protein [Bacillus paranthracis]MBE7114739.1 hypothetical protein [Bacillus paranthracis]MBE7154894.1 hypothetical protein [Bacillus paranthracis]
MVWSILTRRSKKEDLVHEILQNGQLLTAKDARTSTNFAVDGTYIPLFQNMDVDELVKDVLREVNKFMNRSRVYPVDSASIMYSADILRSLSMDFRLDKRENKDLEMLAEHYANCRSTVIYAIEVLEALGYAVRVVEVDRDNTVTNMLSVHW